MAEDRDKGGGKAEADSAGAQGVPHEPGPADKSPKGRGWDLGGRSRQGGSLLNQHDEDGTADQSSASVHFRIHEAQHCMMQGGITS